MEKVIIYTRVSSDEQAKGYSLRDQLDRLQKYCALKNYEIIKHYQEDYSAKTFERPEFKKLLEFVRHNKRTIDRLLILKWDRFSRNATDALNMLRTFEKLNIIIDAVEQPIDLSIPENKLMLNFYLTAPEVENDRRSMNIRNGMRRAMREGKWIIRPPLGYAFIHDKNQKPLLVKGEKADLIAEAFEYIATGGYTVDEVRRRLNKKGLNCSKNNFWHRLKNPVYCGKIAIKSYKDEPEEIVIGIHEPIVSEELFNKVQNVLEHKKKIGMKPKAKSDFLPLRGFLVCPVCGRNWTGSASRGVGGRYYYYHCQDGCKERVKTDTVHNSFSEWLDGFSFKPEIADLYLQIVEETFKKEDNVREKEIQKLKKEIDEVTASLLKTEKKYINDEIEKDSYLLLKESFKKEENELREYLFELQSTDSGFMEYMKYGCSVLSNLRKCYDSSDLDSKQKLLSSIFPEKLIFENGTYRTAKENELLRLLCLNDVAFGEIKKGQSTKKRKLSHQVEIVRLELTTPCMPCKYSSQLSYTPD